MVFIFQILLCVCAFIGCGVKTIKNDWSYEFPHEYFLWHINSRKIVFGKKQTENSIKNIVEDHVIRFCYNDQYVCLQCVEVSENVLEEIDESNPKFYVIDLLNETVDGPLEKNEYEKKLNVLYVDNLSMWIPTKPKPEGAKIP